MEIENYKIIPRYVINGSPEYMRELNAEMVEDDYTLEFNSIDEFKKVVGYLIDGKLMTIGSIEYMIINHSNSIKNGSLILHLHLRSLQEQSKIDEENFQKKVNNMKGVFRKKYDI